MPTPPTLLDLLHKGGWVMIPLFLCSILTLYALIERLITLRRTARAPQRWLTSLHTHLRADDHQAAITLCTKKPYAIAKIVQTGLAQMATNPDNLATTVEHTAQAEVYKLEKNLPLLGTLAGAAPMLGFLGTVLGMIRAFMAIAQATHQISPQHLSSGIYEAMITTAAGLIVGIAAYLSYNYLQTRIQRATHHIEQATHQFLTTAAQNPIPHEAAQ